MTLDQETIAWISVEDLLPEADITVLVSAPGADEPIWLGFYDGEVWISVDGPIYGDPQEIAAKVTAWATMPMGPKVGAA